MEEGRQEHLRDLESNLSDLQKYIRGHSDYPHDQDHKGLPHDRGTDDEPQELAYDRVSFGGGSGRTALTDPAKTTSNRNRFEDIDPSRFKRDLRSQLQDDVLQYSNTERPSSALRGLGTTGQSQVVSLFREYEEMLQQIEGVYAEREHRLESRIAELEAELQAQQQVSARPNPENPPPEVEYLTKTLQRERAERRERENELRVVRRQVLEATKEKEALGPVQEEYQSVQKQLKEVESKYSSLSQETKELESKLAALQAENQLQRKEALALTFQLEEGMKSKLQAEEKAKQLASQEEQWTKELSDKTLLVGEVHKLRQQIEVLESSLGDREAELEEALNRAQSYEDEVRMAREFQPRVEALAFEIEELRARDVELRVELQLRDTETEAARARAKQAKDDLDNLHDDLMQVTSRLRAMGSKLDEVEQERDSIKRLWNQTSKHLEESNHTVEGLSKCIRAYEVLITEIANTLKFVTGKAPLVPIIDPSKLADEQEQSLFLSQLCAFEDSVKDCLRGRSPLGLIHGSSDSAGISSIKRNDKYRSKDGSSDIDKVSNLAIQGHLSNHGPQDRVDPVLPSRDQQTLPKYKGQEDRNRNQSGNPRHGDDLQLPMQGQNNPTFRSHASLPAEERQERELRLYGEMIDRLKKTLMECFGIFEEVLDEPEHVKELAEVFLEYYEARVQLEREEEALIQREIELEQTQDRSERLLVSREVGRAKSSVINIVEKVEYLAQRQRELIEWIRDELKQKEALGSAPHTEGGSAKIRGPGPQKLFSRHAEQTSDQQEALDYPIQSSRRQKPSAELVSHSAAQAAPASHRSGNNISSKERQTFFKVSKADKYIDEIIDSGSQRDSLRPAEEQIEGYEEENYAPQEEFQFDHQEQEYMVGEEEEGHEYYDA